MALSGNENWWDPLGGVVRKVYLVGGGKELFRDHIIEFGARLHSAKNINVDVSICEDESHDGTFMDFETGTSPSSSTIRLGQWIVKSLEVTA